MKSTRYANKSLSEFLHKYEQDNISKRDFDIQHDPVYVNQGIIKVAYDTAEIDFGKTLRLLRYFHPISANSHAFLSGLSFSLVAPLGY